MLRLSDFNEIVQRNLNSASDVLVTDYALDKEISRIHYTPRESLPPPPRVLKKGDVLLGRSGELRKFFYIVLTNADCGGKYTVVKIGGEDWPRAHRLWAYSPHVGSFFYGNKRELVAYHGRID